MRWICLFVHHESYLLPSPKHSDHHVCIESGLEKSSMFQWCPTKVRHPSQCPSNVNDEILLQYATVIHRSGMKMRCRKLDLHIGSTYISNLSISWRVHWTGEAKPLWMKSTYEIKCQTVKQMKHWKVDCCDHFTNVSRLWTAYHDLAPAWGCQNSGIMYDRLNNIWNHNHRSKQQGLRFANLL